MPSPHKVSYMLTVVSFEHKNKNVQTQACHSHSHAALVLTPHGSYDVNKLSTTVRSDVKIKNKKRRRKKKAIANSNIALVNQ